MLILSEDELLMIQKAGFEACFVEDIMEGDVILIDHRLNRTHDGSHSMPTEMTVRRFRRSIHPDHDEDGNTVSSHVLCDWVGQVSRNDLLVHCTYNSKYECWRKV